MDDLRLSFPNDGNGSKIVATTRLEKVGENVMHHIDPYFLPFLTLEESLKLLKRKLFQQEGFPPELQHVSLEIAEKCKGLPLVIVLVAGIIKRNKMEADWWHEVKTSLFSYLGESENYSLSTMQLSYDNLPDYLKPCLLYMGMFPKDEIIPVSKLISLWIAECFVQNKESGRLEEIAEGYLMDLISSNVVMVSKRRYNGKVKYCQVHDVVLHFCLEKSREEKFTLVVKGNFQPLEWKRSRVSFSFGEELSKFASLYSKTRKPFHQHLRSLITRNEGEYSNCNPFGQVSEVKLLKVLDVSSHGVTRLSSATLKPLNHLTYLAVSTNKLIFHLESQLPHLETLIVNSDVDSVLHLERPFWEMKKLRHVDITEAEFDLEEDKHGIFEESSKLEILRILKQVLIDDTDKVDVLLRRCPNLQELDISFKGNYDSPDPFFLKLESLAQLQILRLALVFKLGLQLPSNLNKLVLFTTTIESAIPVIAGLPSLEYLQLLEPSNVVHIRDWCLGDITFHKLKILKLFYLGISRWDASEESFPILEKLVIKQCSWLDEIPLSFEDIPTLKQIKLIYCNESVEASAVKIKEAVKDIEGCNRIALSMKDRQGNIRQL